MSDRVNFDEPTIRRSWRGHSQKVDFWFAIVLMCFTALAWVSWARPGDPIIDFGREVEIAARLADGQVLYRDVNTYYGPLAYYTNAVALLIFGHHLEVFYVVSLVLSFTAALLVYRITKLLTNGAWAALCTVCVLLYCLFSPGIFNFISPYSYGATYALVLSLLAFTAIDRYGRTGKMGWLIAATIAGGFAVLAKQEYGIAAIGSILVGFNLYAPQTLRSRLAGNVLVLSLAIICIVFPLALLAQQVQWQEVQQSLFPASKLTALNQSDIFQVSPIKTLKMWVKTFAISAVGLLLIAVSMKLVRQALNFKKLSKYQRLRSLAEVLISAALAWFSLALLRNLLYLPNLTLFRKLIFPDAVFNPIGNLSWALPIIAGWFAFNRQKLLQHKHAVLLWTILVFTLLLNARWLFFIDFYGLYAMPVIVLFFTFLYLSAQQAKGLVWKYLLICLLIGGITSFFEFRQYRYAIESPYGTMYAKEANVALAFNQTIQTIESSRAESILVLPEGSLINFLTATHSPSRETTFLPSIFPTAQDEAKFVSEMKAAPPELIVYVKRAFPEWHYQAYGEFDPVIDQWIRNDYGLIEAFPDNRDAIVQVYEK